MSGCLPALGALVAPLAARFCTLRLGRRRGGLGLPSYASAETFAFEELDGASQGGPRLVDETIDVVRRFLQSPTKRTGTRRPFACFTRHLVELRLHDDSPSKR